MRYNKGFNNHNDISKLIPLIGVLFYVLIYIATTCLYPGGSDKYPDHAGFDWINNFWCDLTDKITESEEINTARPVAIFGMLVLSFSIGFLAYIIPLYFGDQKIFFLIRYFGLAAMFSANFVFTDFHGPAAYIAGIFGIPPLALAYYGLYKKNEVVLLTIGLISLFFLALNYFIYVSKFYIEILPLIQKIAFMAFLIWICMLDIKVWKALRI